jgi:hypothetical protein
MTRTLLGDTLVQFAKHRRVSPVAKCDGLARRESLHIFKAPFIMVLFASFSVPIVSLLVNCSEETRRVNLDTLKTPFVMVLPGSHRNNLVLSYQEVITAHSALITDRSR